MECKIKNDEGTIYISEDVLMKVVGYAALECYGIVAMCGKRATDGLVEWLGRENLSKGVQIRNVGDMRMWICSSSWNTVYPLLKSAKRLWIQSGISWNPWPA